MKLYAPKYYEKFKCIADKCKHSCCIGWEIDIDPKTLCKYNSLSCEYGKIVKDSIENIDAPHFRLAENERCPHLDDNGLCKIIKNIGEDYLCDICREHPRFYNFTNYGKEVGLGMSCEAACDLILTSDDFDEIIEISNVEGEFIEYEFDSIAMRNQVFKILKDSIKIDEKIKALYNHFDISYIDFNYSDIIFELEYLYDENKELFLNAKTVVWNTSLSNELSRILAYFVYRHCSEAYVFDDFCSSLLFAIFCTGLISTIAEKDTINDIARIVSEEIEYSQENTDRILELFY